MARPQNFDRKEVVEKAMNLFWQKGYNANSVQGLAKVMGISRSSLHNSFSDKKALFYESLQLYQPNFPCAGLEEIKPGDPVIPVIKKILFKTCKAYSEDPEGKGCLIVNSIAELDDSEPEIKKKVYELFKDGLALYTTVLKQAAAQGEIKSDKDPERLALYIVTLQMGLRLISRVFPDESLLRSIAEYTFREFDT